MERFRTSIATVSVRGFVTALRRGEIDIIAKYGSFPSQTESWLVDPLAAPRELLPLIGGVTEGRGGPVEGALAEILNGYREGSSGVSNSLGYYQVERVLTGETLSVRASKRWYEPVTTTVTHAKPTTILNFGLEWTGPP